MSINVGDIYEDWTVIEILSSRNIIMQCRCGFIKKAKNYDFSGMRSKSCLACGQKRRSTNTQIGKKVGMLTVIEFDCLKQGPRGGKLIEHFKCLCDCGNYVSVRKDNLDSARTNKSCGCAYTGANNYGWKGYGEISKQKWTAINRRAIEADIEFSISIEYIWDLFIKQNRKCALTGYDLTMHYTGSHAGDASLDRIDSLRGYIEGNVQWVHKHINAMKLNHSQDFFIKLCKAVADYNV